MNKFLKALLVLWELPQTILAGMLMIFLRKRIVSREAYMKANIIYIDKFPGGISLGRTILLNDKYLGNELSVKHEYGHSIQSLLLGWFYLPIVGLASIMRVAIWRLLRLKVLNYYKGFPEDWANKLGFGKKEYLQLSKKLK